MHRINTKIVAGLVHYVVAIAFISSIFWANWKVVLLVFLLLRLQDELIGGCILTKLQYGSFERRWMETSKNNFIGKYWWLLIDWVIPAILVLLAYLIQQ